MGCNNICQRYKEGKKTNKRYGNNWKYCRGCENRINYEGNVCPCCHTRLRYSQRKKK